GEAFDLGAAGAPQRLDRRVDGAGHRLAAVGIDDDDALGHATSWAAVFPESGGDANRMEAVYQGAPLSRSHSSTTRRVSATSWTRRICTPRFRACMAAASEVGRRSFGSRSLSDLLPSALRETPSRIGQPRP